MPVLAEASCSIAPDQPISSKIYSVISRSRPIPLTMPLRNFLAPALRFTVHSNKFRIYNSYIDVGAT